MRKNGFDWLKRKALGKADGHARLSSMLARALVFFRRLPCHLDLALLGGLLLAGGVGTVFLVASKSGDLLAQIATLRSAGGGLHRSYLGGADYSDYAPTLVRLNPGVSFSLTQEGDALSVSINDESLYPDMMMALHTMQAFKPGVGWEMIEFCIRKCPGDAVSRAVVKGFTQEISQ